ncbi:hypothetical protein [Xanthobacter flavus]|uniref:hypothetical protein n=1 Tax=Xanthobacter flavus TaxID=281 RepID=UPI0037299BFA
MPIEIRITGEPEELAQLLRSWSPGQPSSLRAALELAIANAAPLAKEEIGQENDQALAAAHPAPIQGPPVKLPAKPPDQWKFDDLRKVLLTVAMAAPADIGAREALAAMGIGRLSELPASRYAEYLDLIGERCAPIRTALDQAPWGRRKP